MTVQRVHAFGTELLEYLDEFADCLIAFDRRIADCLMCLGAKTPKHWPTSMPLAAGSSLWGFVSWETIALHSGRLSNSARSGWSSPRTRFHFPPPFCLAALCYSAWPAF